MATKATILAMVGEMEIAFQEINVLEDLEKIVEESIVSKMYLDAKAAAAALGIYKNALERLGLEGTDADFKLSKFKNEATRPAYTAIFQETIRELRRKLKELMTRAFEVIERDKK